MRKRMMCIALAALTACMCLSGCGASSDSKTAERKEGQVVNIYSWNTEFKGIYEAYAKDNFKVKDIIDYVTFYRDPNVLGCCYTKSVIAPKYLTDKDYEIYEPI